jgi:hypothetical protein
MFKLFKPRKKRTLIIGVHGLSNKPPKKQLKHWWRKSIEEGLSKIEGSPTKFDFRMVYWADIMYPKPLSSKRKDPSHPLHIEEPYIPALEEENEYELSVIQRGKNFVQYIKEFVFLGKLGLNNFRKPFDFIVKLSFRDLHEYYNEEIDYGDKMQGEPAKKQIRTRLKKFLLKHKKKEILILAHSMGSIISYDVLYMLQHEIENVTFVSMGSPLGLPLIRENIMKEHNLAYDEDEVKEVEVPTPNSIKAWYNFFDKEDPFALHHLNTIYQPNSLGIAPMDSFVENDYKHWVTNNAHKSFGYLRAPRIAKIISDFLQGGRSSMLTKGKQMFKNKGRA